MSYRGPNKRTQEMMIRETQSSDLPGLTQVIDETGLFPSEMLPELIWTAFRAETADRFVLVEFEGNGLQPKLP